LAALPIDGTVQSKPVTSCRELRRINPMAQSGTYWIDADGAGPLAAIEVACDMATEGGGWTELMQCLPGDACAVGGTTLYNVNWLGSDYGTVDAAASYLMGAALAPLVAGASQFMVEITDTSSGDRGAVIYPYDSRTWGFFSAAAFFESPVLPLTLLDYDGRRSDHSGRICWAPTDSYQARTYQGQNGLTFLGQTVPSAPNPTANTGCDYGPWGTEILIRNASLGASFTAAWGIAPAASWSTQPYAHRIYVR